ncbi:MAG: Ppx/GppA family phosphatase, partial [Campylobacter sp.]|nr:Ppx/GppA family phosphatase [Campylobacter sp.]
EGAYENGGILTKDAMQKSLLAFKKFKTLIGNYKVKRVLCIGTSALRDAPNGTGFIKLVRKQTGIAIRKIDGQTEAYLGAYAAQNLLSNFDGGVTLDIGGGSTELALIKNGKIEKTLSLNLGTVRLKELFFDRGDAKGLEKYVSRAVARIGGEFCTQNLIVMGGSARALSSAVMSLQNHPLKIVHNFSYDYEKYAPFFAKLMSAKTLDLAKFPIKKDRYDTIREGAIVFDKIVKRLGAKKVITCGAGVREGAFLNSILRGARLPKNFNPSLRSLLDRFAPEPSSAPKFAKALFCALSPMHGLSEKYIKILQIAASLCEIGRAIGFYAKHETSADM